MSHQYQSLSTLCFVLGAPLKQSMSVQVTRLKLPCTLEGTEAQDHS